MTTGEKIKFLRSEAKLSQTALAKMVGVSGQVISNIERGYTRPPSELVNKLASCFGVPSDYILGLSGTRWMANSPYWQVEIFKERISERMQHLQMDASSLSEILSISESVCEDIISGEVTPSVDSLSGIASALHTTIDYLIGTSIYAIAVSSEDEEDILAYFRKMDKSQKRRFMGFLEELKNE